MKTNHRIIPWVALLALLSTLNPQLSTLHAQGTAFTYQGQLQNNGSPASGTYNLTFSLFNTETSGVAVAGPVTNNAVGVTNGLFTVTIDFGSGVWNGATNWLEISVETNSGSSSFTTLAPRQQLTPVPYAIMANSASNLLGTLPAAQLSGTLPSSVLAGYSGTVTLTNGGNNFNGSFSGSFGGSGAGLTNVPGSVVWQNVTGTSQQAQPNTGYLANNAAPVTITLPTAPNLGDIVRVSGVGAGGWQIAQNAGQMIQATFCVANYTNWESLITSWTQASAPAGNGAWSFIASSADGRKLVAVNGSNIYTSTDSGVTWIQTSARSTNYWGWMSIASSADGTKLAAVAYDDGIYTSANSGVTWSQTSAPGEYWSSIASSADGTKLAAAVNWAGGFYTSTDSGVTWTLQTKGPGGNVERIASSADGTKLAAVCDSGIYTSTDSGVTWTQTSAQSVQWEFITSSADGTKLAAVVYSGGIYTSTDSGVTWTQTSAPSAVWDSVASSADGTKLAAVVQSSGGGIYTSTDSGVTWTQTSAPGTYWHSITSSAEGTKLAAVGDSGIWTAQASIQKTTTTPGTAGYLTGGQNSAVELQYIDNGQFLPLSHEGTVSAY